MRSILFFISVGFLSPNCILAAAPTLSHLFPAGGQRGTTVSLTCHGKFEWPVRVHASGLEVSTLEESGRISITIPEDILEDRIWVRLFNAEGASQAVPFLINNLSECLEIESNDAPKQAQLLEPLPLVINGELIGADADCYLIQVEAGQTLVAAVDANSRLGSPIDSVLQIASADGTVLVDNHDSMGLDPRVEYTVKNSGKYLVRIFGFASEPNQSITLQGCKECVYRLTITTGPFVVAALPFAVSRNSEILSESTSGVDGPPELSHVELVGTNLVERLQRPVLVSDSANIAGCCEAVKPGSFQLPSESQIGYVQLKGLAGCARVRLVQFAASLNRKSTENSQPLSLELPQAVTGHLSQPNQIDRYRLSLRKGDSLIVTVEAQTFGMSTDPLARLLDSAGNRIVEVDDSAGTKDVVINHTAETDGELMIEVMDRFRSGDSYNFYLLVARLVQPDFEITVKSDQIIVPAKGVAELAVQVSRRGSVGSITITASDLPDGITVEPVVSATEGDTATAVNLKFKNSGIVYSGPIRINGSSVDPISLQRKGLTEPRMGVSLECIWLTGIASESPN